MAYQMKYDFQRIYIFRRNQKHKIKSIICLSVFLTIVAFLGNGLGSLIRESLLPLYCDNLASAEQFAADLRECECFADAVQTFCAELIP